MARKTYTAESGLGFMRVIQIFNVLYIFACLLMMFFVSSQSLTPSMQTGLLCMVADMVVQTILVWLIAKRKNHTRYIAVGIYIFEYIDMLISMTANGIWDPVVAAVASLDPILLSIYFLTSRRAKAVLVQPFDVKIRDKSLAKDRVMWNPKSLEFWMRLLLYFFAFSIMGHWMEMGVQVLVVNGIMPGTVASADSLTWRDSWNPFPIYGIAVAICGLALYPVYAKLRDKMPKTWQAFVLSFLVNTVFCVAAELVLGMIFNADHHAWDYSNQPFNWEGQICLLYTICFGVMSSLITWVIYPLLERQFSYVSHDVFRIIFVVCLVIYLFIFVTYNIDPNVFSFGGEHISVEIETGGK